MRSLPFTRTQGFAVVYEEIPMVLRIRDPTGDSRLRQNPGAALLTNKRLLNVPRYQKELSVSFFLSLS
jgi:hypothetical protein